MHFGQFFLLKKFLLLNCTEITVSNEMVMQKKYKKNLALILYISNLEEKKGKGKLNEMVTQKIYMYINTKP